MKKLQDKEFLRVPLSLLQNTKDVLSSTDILVYTYIHQKMKFFVEEKKGEYYESQETIADILGMNPQTVRRSLLKLEKEGILKVERKRYKGVRKNYYVFIKDLPGMGVSKEILPSKFVDDFDPPF